MRIERLLTCLPMIITGLLFPACSVFAQSLPDGRIVAFPYVFSDSVVTGRDGVFGYPGFFDMSSRATRLSLLDRSSSSSFPLTLGNPNSLPARPERNRVNCRRASVLCTANAAALFFGFKGAMEAWGESKGAFHIKDDWSGDELKQTDELSHFMWGYKMTQFLFSAYRWSGFSTQASHYISVFQTALVLTMVEYPIDAYNPQQGLGLSDLAVDYAGVGLACPKRRFSALDDFDLKISWKRNVFFSNQPMFAQTYEEFDNFIYWFTYRTRLFLPQKIVCLGLGCSATRREGVGRRQVFAGVGLSLPDLAGLFGEKLKARAGFLGVFYPNLRMEL